MRKALLGMALGLMAAQAGAADAGLGLSLRSNDAWIYVPIDFGKVRIEPSVRYVETKSNSTSTDTSLFFPVTSTVKAKDRTYEFAFGVFGLADLMDNVSLYYGARAAYID
jgi:hypothetical protein